MLAFFLLVDRGEAAISGMQQIATGLHKPAFATHAPGDENRLFVAELGGRIKVIDLTSNTVLPTPFLHITDTDAAGEGGLLGLAFHPNYFAPLGTPGRGKFYVYVTVDNDGDTSLGVVSPFSSHIREYSVLGDPATSNVADTDANSQREILSFVQPQTNHNAGWIGFNPPVTENAPQYLYIASGDGGGQFDSDAGHSTDVPGNAQDITNNLLGKILRIDVNGDDFPGNTPEALAKNYAIPPDNPFEEGVGVPEDDIGDDEIWSHGLRNPFRNSFDRLTGDLWLADVGQNQREEIDFQPASSAGGENYGWRLREGTLATLNVGGPLLPSYTQPIYDYSRGSGSLQGETVIGGYSYRGPDPELQGRYFFGDAHDRHVWQMTLDPGVTVTNIDSALGALFASVNYPASFAEDAHGNLYVIDLSQYDEFGEPIPNTGEVYRIVTDKVLPGDYNADGEVNDFDYDKWRQSFATASLAADGNGDAVVDAADYVVWRKHVGLSVHSGAAPVNEPVPEPAGAACVVQAIFLLAIALMGPRGSSRSRSVNVCPCKCQNEHSRATEETIERAFAERAGDMSQEAVSKPHSS
jgi:glucose/arabinose dehydrogenase